MNGPVRDADHLDRVTATGLARASRWRRVGFVALAAALLVILGAVTFALASVTGPESVRWLTGAILIGLLAATWLLCAHSGGHGWFVPFPALVLAGLWAVTVSGRPGQAAWWLVAMSAAAAAFAVVVASTALRQQLRLPPEAPLSPAGGSGTAVTALDPVGVVRVAGESWTAMSLSGQLPAGAPVHVVRVDGVRLDVWSEAGMVPDHRSLEDHRLVRLSRPTEEERT